MGSIMTHSAFDVCQETGEEKVMLNRTYASSIVAITKAIEFILFMFSFALASDFKAGLAVYIQQMGKGFHIPHGRVDLHIFIMCVSWVGVILLSSAYLFNVVNVIKVKTRHIFLLLAIVHMVGVIFIFISTCMILNNVVSFRNNRVIRLPKGNLCDSVLGCSSYEGAGATSFFSIIFLSFDTVLHVVKAIKVRRQQKFEKGEEEGGGDEGDGPRVGGGNQSYDDDVDDEQQTTT